MYNWFNNIISGTHLTFSFTMLPHNGTNLITEVFINTG